MTTPATGLIRFKVGDRVQMHPATDAWMAGARYGTVEVVPPRRFGRPYSVLVRMDRSKRLQRVNLSNLLPLDI